LLVVALGYASPISDESVQSPHWTLLALEGRTILEFSAFVWSLPLLQMTARGDGHPVLVLPPFAVNDSYTQPLRWFLARMGYEVHGWNLGRNLGMTAEALDGLPVRLQEINQRAGVKVSIVGWSAGGILARELARDHPGAVRTVITLAAPFRMRHADRYKTHASQLYRLVEHLQAPPPPRWLRDEARRGRVPVPVTSIYSRTDGVAPWRMCLEGDGPERENIEVVGSHIGLGHNPAVAFAVADRLAQPVGTWKPFRPPDAFRPFYPRPATWPRKTARSRGGDRPTADRSATTRRAS
jgi:pimeloyl-ACP methyl ester carboxylesterase